MTTAGCRRFLLRHLRNREGRWLCERDLVAFGAEFQAERRTVLADLGWLRERKAVERWRDMDGMGWWRVTRTGRWSFVNQAGELQSNVYHDVLEQAAEERCRRLRRRELDRLDREIAGGSDAA